MAKEGQNIRYQSFFLDEMGFGAVAFSFGIISGADIIVPFSRGGFSMDGREPMAAVLTEQEICERAGGGSAAISGSGAIGFFSLDPGKIGGINDSRVVVREKMLLVFWHALILSVNRGAGAFFQAENSRVKIIVKDFLYHTIGPAVGNGAPGEFSKLDFPFVERL